MRKNSPESNRLSIPQLEQKIKKQSIELELKNRELEIEAALERIRSRTMAMQKSDELAELNAIILQQVNILKVPLFAAGIHICNKDKPITETWIGDPSEGQMPKVIIDHSQDPLCARMYSGWKKGNEFSIEVMKNEALEEHFKFMATAIPNQFMFEELSLPERLIFHLTYFSRGFFVFTTLDPYPEHHDIFKRFAKVFEQTYTRFLDLKKAEEQAMEAQIETAMERVRASTMAMHQSDQLSETATVMFEQFHLLGQLPDRIGICIFNEQKKVFEFWPTDQAGSQLKHTFNAPIHEPTTIHKLYKAWKENKDSKIVDLTGQDLKNWIRFVREDMGLAVKESHIKSRRVHHAAFFTHGFLLYTTHEQIEPEFLGLLVRFAKVFDQTYTRFLDLKKAESQAREAQIEAALERVRTKSMAMHKSDQLLEVIITVFDQFQKLDIETDGAHIHIFDDTKDFNLWIANPEQNYVNRIHIPYFNRPLFNNFWKSLAQDKKFITENHSRKEKDFLFKHFFEHSDLKKAPAKRKKFLLDSAGWARSIVFGKNAALSINNFEGIPYSAEENEILKRFGKVFEQSYTRFLDLKKAEEQSREAQIEAALERVRAQAMAMQHSEDLAKSTSVLLEELEQLNLEVLRCGIAIIDPSTFYAKVYSTTNTRTGKKELVTGSVDMHTHPAWVNSIEAWKKQELSSYVLEGEELSDYYEQLSKAGYKLPKKMLQSIKLLKKQYYYNVLFSQGGLFIISNSPISDENLKIIQRFADVYNLTYTRYEDLQNAEKRTLEAVRQASLDRVRGVIASMRTKEDLNRITPLIWKELTALGVPFIRCGVFIMDVEKEVIQSYLSTPDGKTLGVFNLPFTSELIGELMVDFWQKGKIYKDHWTKKRFIEFMQKLKDSGQLKDTGSYQGTATPPEKLDLHFIPFKQGMLYVGNTEPLSKDELQLVGSLAEAFSIAYARYEDFRELELAKNQIESTLNELKSTQSQLIHAEKMASLGELTAGIAHEIQNPLNFVNNFSEVSVDLIEELKAERNKGTVERDESLEDEILYDVIQNLEKINHHGQRASSIVKGMLEHSRAGSKDKQLTDINALVDEYLRLAYHGLRAKDKSFNADFKLEIDKKLPKIKVFPQDIGRVLLNLINNAFYAVNRKAKSGIKSLPAGASAKVKYKPEITVSTKNLDNSIEIYVKDNGPGIPEDIKDKIFQPFFTTKPTGQGTGLGLSLSYDIVKAHGGELKVETKENEGSEFIIVLGINTN